MRRVHRRGHRRAVVPRVHAANAPSTALRIVNPHRSTRVIQPISILAAAHAADAELALAVRAEPIGRGTEALVRGI